MSKRLCDLRGIHIDFGKEPIDLVEMTSAQEEMLGDLWRKYKGLKTDEEYYRVPSDLYFAGTIPLKTFDMAVTVGRDRMKVRFSLIDNPVFNDEGCADIMKIYIFSDDNKTFIGAMPVYVKYGEDCIFYRKARFLNRELIKDVEAAEEINKGAIGFLSPWYGIQLALLHPTVREVFSSARTAAGIRDSDSGKKGKSRNVVQYVRVVRMNEDDLKTAIYGSHSAARNRKALIWAVIGHWRKYKNGRTIFIKPYFKGSMRSVKGTDTGEQRKRKIIINEEALA